MKILELERALAEFREKHGDVDVHVRGMHGEQRGDISLVEGEGEYFDPDTNP